MNQIDILEKLIAQKGVCTGIECIADGDQEEDCPFYHKATCYPEDVLDEAQRIKATNDVCVFTEVYIDAHRIDNCYDTGCMGAVSMQYDDKYIYCPFCGRKIVYR